MTAHGNASLDRVRRALRLRRERRGYMYVTHDGTLEQRHPELVELAIRNRNRAGNLTGHATRVAWAHDTWR